MPCRRSAFCGHLPRLCAFVLVLCVFFTGAGLAPRVAARTVQVPADHATLLAALTDTTLTHGDTILVGPGTYTGPGNRDLSFNGKNLVLLSTHGAAVTILDLQASEEDNHRGFLFAGGQFGTETHDAVLDGFTILNGVLGVPAGPQKFAGNRLPQIRHDLSGAGIMCRNDASPTVRNCIVRNCSSEYTGGGIGVEFFSEPVFENVVVQGCVATIQGGGISVETFGNATFVDCVVTGNSSINGGGIAAHAAVVLQGCVVADNVARRGGGVDLVLGSAVQVERSIVWKNCAIDSGAQLYVDPAIPTPVVISCSAIDTLGIRDLGDLVTVQQGVFGDPQFCEAVGCEAAPTTSGQYTLREGSPCLPAGNPCGLLLGPNPNACSTAVRQRSISQVKSLFR